MTKQMFRTFVVLPKLISALTLNEGRTIVGTKIHRCLLPSRHFHASSQCFYSADESEKSSRVVGETVDLVGKERKTDQNEQKQPTNEEGEGKQEFELPFGVDVAPKRMRNKAGEFRASAYRLAQGNKSYLTQEEREGTIGAGSLLSMDTSEVDKYLPTIKTMDMLFDDVPFVKLPVVYIKASWNNTIVHAFDVTTKRAIMYTSARKEGYKHAKKKTPLAGQAAGVGAGQKLLRRGVTTVRVMIKGIGPGRISSVKGLVASGVTVVSITDHTRLPELGPRPRALRRV